MFEVGGRGDRYVLEVEGSGWDDVVDEEAVARKGEGGGLERDARPAPGIEEEEDEEEDGIGGADCSDLILGVPGAPLGVVGVPGWLSISSLYANLKPSGSASSFLVS